MVDIIRAGWVVSMLCDFRQIWWIAYCCFKTWGWNCLFLINLVWRICWYVLVWFRRHLYVLSVVIAFGCEW